MGKRAKPAPIEVRRTLLEATSPGPRVPAPMGMQLALIRVKDIPPSYYRYLYEQVGKLHHWEMRRNASDEELVSLLHRPETEIRVLQVDGAPAGFCELNLEGMPETVELLYFGLTSDFQGRGLSRYFLSEAMQAAFNHEPRRLVLETNTLDSPRALLTYQKAGFRVTGTEAGIVTPWL